jgi:hypothetical protein
LTNLKELGLLSGADDPLLRNDASYGFSVIGETGMLSGSQTIRKLSRAELSIDPALWRRVYRTSEPTFRLEDEKRIFRY